MEAFQSSSFIFLSSWKGSKGKDIEKKIHLHTHTKLSLLFASSPPLCLSHSSKNRANGVRKPRKNRGGERRLDGLVWLSFFVSQIPVFEALAKGRARRENRQED